MDLAVPALAAARAGIDAVNVFPVADGDTGTNALLTVRGAAEAVAGLAPGEAGADVLRALGRGAQLAARGSSGVILSRYLGGLAEAADAPLPDALLRAADAARGAVHRPEDGTVLTLAARVAAVARDVTGDEARALAAGVGAGRADLAGISAAHPVLRSARVVDAGACALLVLLDALVAALRGATDPVDVSWLAEHADGVTDGAAGGAVGGGAGPDERVFEVMAVLRASGRDVADGLRASLAAVGDAVAVVEGDELLTAHVHADDPGAALAAVGSSGSTGGTWTATVRVLVGGADPVVACTAHPALAGTLALAGAVALVLPDGVPADQVRAAVARAVQDAAAPAHGPAPAGDDPAGRVVVLAGDRLPAGAADPGWAVRPDVTDELGVVAAVVAGPGATTTTTSAADPGSALTGAARLLVPGAGVDPAGPRTLTVLLGPGAAAEDGLDLADLVGARFPGVAVAVAGPVPAGPAFGLAASHRGTGPRAEARP